jgi:hypothetical protein
VQLTVDVMLTDPENFSIFGVNADFEMRQTAAILKFSCHSLRILTQIILTYCSLKHTVVIKIGKHCQVLCLFAVTQLQLNIN